MRREGMDDHAPRCGGRGRGRYARKPSVWSAPVCCTRRSVASRSHVWGGRIRRPLQGRKGYGLQCNALVRSGSLDIGVIEPSISSRNEKERPHPWAQKTSDWCTPLYSAALRSVGSKDFGLDSKAPVHTAPDCGARRRTTRRGPHTGHKRLRFGMRGNTQGRFGTRDVAWQSRTLGFRSE